MTIRLSPWFALLLFSCSSLPPIKESDGGWVFEAKVNYRDGQQIKNGLLRWEQQGEDYVVKLSGIIGGEFARLRKTGGQFNLRVQGQEYKDLKEINSLLTEKTGVPIPAENLQYWLKQEPNPAQPFSAERDYRGRLILLSQDLWQIYYDYQRNRARRITAEKPPYRIVLVTIKAEPSPTTN